MRDAGQTTVGHLLGIYIIFKAKASEAQLGLLLTYRPPDGWSASKAVLDNDQWKEVRCSCGFGQSPLKE